MLIEEFVRRLDEMRIQYPGDAEDVLEAGAKKMTKAIRKASPVGDTNHPHKLKKSWRCKIKGYRAADTRAEIRSTAGLKRSILQSLAQAEAAVERLEKRG